MIRSTPLNLVETSRRGIARQYELTVTYTDHREYRHYFSYRDALADFNEAVAAGFHAFLHRLDEDGLDALLGFRHADATRVPPDADPGEVLHVKTVTACTNSEGSPDFTFSVIRCTQDQYDEGDHYEAAKDQAREDGYEGEMVVFDENDIANGPTWLIGFFEWTSLGEPVNLL